MNSIFEVALQGNFTIGVARFFDIFDFPEDVDRIQIPGNHDFNAFDLVSMGPSLSLSRTHNDGPLQERKSLVEDMLHAPLEAVYCQ